MANYDEKMEAVVLDKDAVGRNSNPVADTNLVDEWLESAEVPEPESKDLGGVSGHGHGYVCDRKTRGGGPDLVVDLCSEPGVEAGGDRSETLRMAEEVEHSEAFPRADFEAWAVDAVQRHWKRTPALGVEYALAKAQQKNPVSPTCRKVTLPVERATIAFLHPRSTFFGIPVARCSHLHS